jgi:integrase
VGAAPFDGARMTIQTGQLFKVRDGNWGYRYRDTRTGKRPRKSGFKTKGEASTALNAHLERLRIGGQYRPQTTMRLIHDEFFATYTADDVTVSWMKYHAAKVIVAFGDEHPDSLDAATVARWRQGLANKASANQTHRVFRQLLRAAVSWGWIRTNVAAQVKNPIPRRPEVESFEDWQQVDQVAAELGADPWGSVILIVGVGTGLRPEELFGLNWSDIDLARRVLTVRRVYTKGVEKPYGKTEGSMRRVPLRARVVDALERLPHRRGFVFHGEKGGRVYLNAWRADTWKPAFEAAGVDYLVPYAMRHTYAAWSLAAGINIFTLARRMGTSVAMVERTYGHLAKDADDYERGLLDAWDVVGNLNVNQSEDQHVR